MPVPSSFNDITVETGLRDYVGWVWYDRQFFAPISLPTDKRYRIRFGSAHYAAVVWVNGIRVCEHEGGHLPFEGDVTAALRLDNGPNRVTAAVNNTLTRKTIPQGEWKWKSESDEYPPGYFTLDYTFDFFNYAGIHRPVVLYTTPVDLSVEDFSFVTSYLAKDLSEVEVDFDVDYYSNTGFKEARCEVTLLDGASNVSAASSQCRGKFRIPRPNLWWPYLMSENPGYLYTLDIRLSDALGNADRYRQPVGIRFVSWDANSFKINHKNFYFRGFGKHEDANIRGKGLDLPTVAKDFNLIKWIGANSFRTSHYPYAEEIMDFADRNGIVVIDEVPAVNLYIFHRPLLENHIKAVDELIARDKNRPSVVMWSLANEAKSDVPKAKSYFETVANHTKTLDPTRPVTVVTFYPVDSDFAPYAADIISVNKYAAWYTDTGHTELIERQIVNLIRAWREKHGKLVLVSEYGADTIHGFHELPSTIFTEEYQNELMTEYFKSFETLRNESILCGEMIWNFADFMTRQEYKRAWGNRKGIFTRDRHPKAAAHLLKERYWDLAARLDGTHYERRRPSKCYN